MNDNPTNQPSRKNSRLTMIEVHDQRPLYIDYIDIPSNNNVCMSTHHNRCNAECQQARNLQPINRLHRRLQLRQTLCSKFLQCRVWSTLTLTFTIAVSNGPILGYNERDIEQFQLRPEGSSRVSDSVMRAVQRFNEILIEKSCKMSKGPARRQCSLLDASSGSGIAF